MFARGKTLGVKRFVRSDGLLRVVKKSSWTLKCENSRTRSSASSGSRPRAASLEARVIIGCSVEQPARHLGQVPRGPRLGKVYLIVLNPSE